MLVADYPDGAGPGQVHVPIADQPLPGLPEEHSTLLSGSSLALGGVTHSQSRYWLRLHKHDPITRAKDSMVQAGDLLLFEADRLQFAPPESIYDRLCVIRVTVRGQLQIKLAEVSYAGDDIFDADTFDLHPPREPLVEEIVLRRPTGGKFSVVKESVTVEKQQQGIQKSRGRPPHHLEKLHPMIRFVDIIAVHLRLIHR